MNGSSGPQDGVAVTIPPLPPGVQATILSHLLPPAVPLPQQLLSKSLLQRHLYLPPSPDDVDGWLAPLPENGLSGKLERLAGVGWRVDSVQYGGDGESVLARMGVVEDGQHGARGERVDVLFEWEGGKDGRGWTYLSTGVAPGLEWRTDPSHLASQRADTMTTEHTNGTHVDPTAPPPESDSAPEGYWSGFSPPTSPLPSHDGGPETGTGEDDYWASYGKAYTPAGGVTPAIQRSPTVSSTALPPDHTKDDLETTPPDRPAQTQAQDDASLLRSRMEMKIASILRRLWLAYEPTSDPEHRALTFLSLARSVRAGGGGGGGLGNGSVSDDSGLRGQLETLSEIYGVLEKDPQVAADGFYRLVEGSLTGGGGRPEGWGWGFGPEDRQDSSAQLNYWE